MKKAISIILAVGILAAGSVSASAGGYRYYGGHGGYYHGGHGGYYHGGYGPGAFFVGLLGGAILGSVIANATQPAVVYAPPPPPPPPAQVWVPGHYERRYGQRWVEGYWASGNVWVPGHYENVGTQVWIPGHWEDRG